MVIILFIAPTAFAGSAADDLVSAEAEYQALLKSEKRSSTKSLWTQVIASFEEVVDDHPDSPEAPLAIFRQGELYMEMFTYSITLGELLKAEKAFRRVIADYPDHELADESRTKLLEIDDLRTNNCLVRVTPETNLAGLLIPEETETTEVEETKEPSKKESRREKRKNRKTEEPADTDIPNPNDENTPVDPIETIIAEETIVPETIVPEETEPAPTETETVTEAPSSPEPVIAAETSIPTNDAEESFGIGSLESEGSPPEEENPEPLLLPVSALSEVEDIGSTHDNDERVYDAASPVYTDGLPQPTTVPPVPEDSRPESPSSPVDSLYSKYQEDNGGTRMLTPAAPLASTTVVTGIRYFTDTDHTRIVLDTDNAAAFFDSRLPENSDRGLPPRIYIDVFGAELSLDRTGPIDIDDGFVHAIRWSQYNSETVRVVMDLETPRDYRIFTLSDPHRVVVDIMH